jgi:MFS family permease
MDYSKNIRNYYLFSTFSDLLILGPILVLYLSNVKGLSFTEIMLLQSISAVSVVLFEVPTGAIADLLGRKISLVIYGILVGISLVVYMLGESFLVFMLAEIIFSLGASLRSGADSAIIYDSLKLNGREGEYQRIEGKARSLSLYAQAVGSIIAGFVYEISPYLPFIISVVFMIFTAIICMGFLEPPFKPSEKEEQKGYLSQIIESGKFIARHEKLKAVVFFCMIFFLFYRAGSWYFQPYMEAVNIPVKYFGVIFFLFNITAAFISKRSYYIMDRTKPKTLTFMAALMVISFLLLSVIKIPLGVLAILLQQAARGLYRPVTTKYLNKHIPSDMRATVLSFQSLLSNLTVAAIFPLMGLLKDKTTIYTTHLILGITMAVLIALITGYMNARIGFKKTLEL